MGVLDDTPERNNVFLSSAREGHELHVEKKKKAVKNLSPEMQSAFKDLESIKRLLNPKAGFGWEIKDNSTIYIAAEHAEDNAGSYELHLGETAGIASAKLFYNSTKLYSRPQELAAGSTDKVLHQLAKVLCERGLGNPDVLEKSRVAARDPLMERSR